MARRVNRAAARQVQQILEYVNHNNIAKFAHVSFEDKASWAEHRVLPLYTKRDSPRSSKA